MRRPRRGDICGGFERDERARRVRPRPVRHPLRSRSGESRTEDEGHAGVWVGGGIAPKILPRLKRPGFLEAFHDKGRFRAFLEAIPVRVILNDQTALRGAAWHVQAGRA